MHFWQRNLFSPKRDRSVAWSFAFDMLEVKSWPCRSAFPKWQKPLGKTDLLVVPVLVPIGVSLFTNRNRILFWPHFFLSIITNHHYFLHTSPIINQSTIDHSSWTDEIPFALKLVTARHHPEYHSVMMFLLNTSTNHVTTDFHGILSMSSKKFVEMQT